MRRGEDGCVSERRLAKDEIEHREIRYRPGNALPNQGAELA